MPIPVVCACGAKLKVGDHLKGKHIKCPKCGSVLSVGAPEKAPAPAARVSTAALPSTAEVLERSELSGAERERLEEELGRDERLLWAGKPLAARAFLYGWAYAAGFLFGAAVIVLILVLVSRDGMMSDSTGTTIRILLGVVAFGMVVAAFVWPYIYREYARRTTYAATTKRALVWGCTWYFKSGLNVYEPRDVTKLYRVDLSRGPDALGHVVLGTQTYSRKTREGIQRSYRRYGFFLIRRPADVEKLLREHLVDPILDRLYEE